MHQWCWLTPPAILPNASPGRSRIPAVNTRACATSQESRTHPRTPLFLPDASHTYHLGRLLAADTRAGDILLLSGELGAGKTALARGFVHFARQDDALEVTSPTYLLANTYPPMKPDETAPPVVHMDLWRLEEASQRPIVDFDQVFREFASLIEWPDRLGSLRPLERLEVLLEYPEKDGKTDEGDPWGFGSGDLDDVGVARDGRFASLMPYGERWTKRVEQLYEKYAQLDQQGRPVILAE